MIRGTVKIIELRSAKRHSLLFQAAVYAKSNFLKDTLTETSRTAQENLKLNYLSPPALTQTRAHAPMMCPLSFLTIQTFEKT